MSVLASEGRKTEILDCDAVAAAMAAASAPRGCGRGRGRGGGGGGTTRKTAARKTVKNTQAAPKKTVQKPRAAPNKTTESAPKETVKTTQATPKKPTESAPTKVFRSAPKRTIQLASPKIAQPENATESAAKKRKATAVEDKDAVEKPTKRLKEDDASSPQAHLHQRDLQARMITVPRKSRQTKPPSAKDTKSIVKESATSPLKEVTTINNDDKATSEDHPATPAVVATASRPSLTTKDPQASNHDISIAASLSKVVRKPHEDVSTANTAKTMIPTSPLISQTTKVSSKPPSRVFFKPKPNISAACRNVPASKTPVRDPFEPPLLKNGAHGPCRDFVNDPDLITGRGHQITLEHREELNYYYHFQQRVLSKYPQYPKVPAGEVVDQDLKATWIHNERWFAGFRDLYMGYAVAHLWDCGCEKPRDDDESEEE